MKRLTALLATASLAALALAPAARAEFGIEPGSFFAKTHAHVPLRTAPGEFYLAREVDTEAIKGIPPVVEAGAHPDATSGFTFNQGGGQPDDNVKDIVVDLPPGFIGDPEAVPACSRDEFAELTGVGNGGCPPASQVGVVTAHISGLVPYATVPVYRLTTAFGRPASFGFSVLLKPILLQPRLRSDGDYGLSVVAPNISDFFPLKDSTITFWGVPADPVHEPERWYRKGGSAGWGAASEATPKAFLANPTWCDSGPLDAAIRVRSWQDPTRWLPDDPADPNYHSASPAPTDCERLRFGGPAAPVSLTFQPTVHAAETPSGYTAKLTLPYNDNPNGLANPTLRHTEVVLPEGVVVNPSSANGLGACTSAQIGFVGGGFPEPRPLHFTGEAAHCADSSKLGTVEVHSPLLEHPLSGDVYLAKQGDNPFHSNLAIYIAVNDPETGIVVKLAGKVGADPTTGRLTTTFTDNPQLPFTELDLHFFGGPGASLINPPTCGTKTTTSILTPWSAPYTPPVTSTDSFDITSGPNGSSCANSEAEEPNTPSFEAGTLTPIAGSYSPFVLHLRREDGSQQFQKLDVTLPPGLTGKLAGIPYCQDADLAAAELKTGVAEREAASCPTASQVGTVTVGAGAGPQPFHVQGKAYLAGPYKGAPLSLAIITPAVAGPFDLGTVVVRSALYVNPVTAQIRAVSDPIPHILDVEGDGFPLDLRSIDLTMARRDFTLNPTNCNELGFTGSALSVLGQSAPLADRFQVGACKALDFAPKLALSLKGPTHRAAHPRFRAVLQMQGGEANIARAAVTLPHSMFLDQSHIRTVCTRVQFAQGSTPGEKCPVGSVYGHARAITPLLDQPLEGPVYLRSSSHNLPDLVAALNGQIQVVLDGRIDSVHGGIRNTFEVVPDAPVSKFILEMKGGSKGLLVNSTNICKGRHAVVAKFDGQNGMTHDIEPLLKNSACGRHRK